jgi:O-antigen ligase
MTLASASRAARTAFLTGEMVILAWLFATEDLGQLGFLSFIVGLTVGTVALIFGDWPVGCFLVLALGAAMPRFQGVLFSLHVRPEHIATLVAIVAIGIQLYRGKIELSLRLRNFDYWLIAYVAINFLSSVVNSPDPRKTLTWATLNAVVVTPYFLVRLLVRTDQDLWRALHGLLYIGVAESIYGTIAAISNHLFDSSWGVELGQYGSIPGTYGTQYEANLFGSYTACTAVMCLALFLFSKQSGRSWYRLGLVFGLIGAVFSMTRAVFIALPITILALVVFSARKGQFRLRWLLPVAIGVGVLLAILSPLVFERLNARFGDKAEMAADSSTVGRLIQIGAAIEDVKDHPILGTGTSSFQLMFKMNDVLQMNYEDDDVGWISNSPLRVLHDTGIVGLTILMAFLGTLAMAAYKALRGATRTTKLSIAALSVGLLLYAICFQATEATLLTFTWIHLALLSVAVECSRRGEHVPA